MNDRSEPKTIDCQVTAKSAGLIYAATDAAGLQRSRAGRGFSYRAPDGNRVTDPRTLRRIRALAIPPAWTQVWICPQADGHIQAVGHDEKGRKQYRYHAKFREVRDGVKFEHMMAFAEALPPLRRQVASDMATPGLRREKILATVVHLLETTMIRVGNAAYARTNKSYGLTTLLNRHVSVEGSDLRFQFKGKSGKLWRLKIHDRRIAAVVKRCQDIPGQHLFQYQDAEGHPQAVTSADVNAYLRAISGADITAKDFRTWTGTVLAAVALAELEVADTRARAKQNVTAAIERVAARLGNTAAICRKCYVHPDIVTAYLDGALRLEVSRDIDAQLSDGLAGLRPEEDAVLTFLRTRTTRDLARSGATKTDPTAHGREARPLRGKEGRAPVARTTSKAGAVASRTHRMARDTRMDARAPPHN